METIQYREGDRVEYVGQPVMGSRDPASRVPDLFPGERGWVQGVDRDGAVIVRWDQIGSQAHSPADLRAVVGRNEPDATKQLPGDPFGSA